MPTAPNLADWFKSASLMTSGTGQVFIVLLQDEEFRTSLMKIIENPQGKTFWLDQGGLILVIWFIRAWRLGKSVSWGGKLWTQAWIGALYWVSAFVVIPFSLWGGDYGTVVSHSLRAIFHVIFA